MLRGIDFQSIVSLFSLLSFCLQIISRLRKVVIRGKDISSSSPGRRSETDMAGDLWKPEKETKRVERSLIALASAFFLSTAFSSFLSSLSSRQEKTTHYSRKGKARAKLPLPVLLPERQPSPGHGQILPKVRIQREELSISSSTEPSIATQDIFELPWPAELGMIHRGRGGRREGRDLIDRMEGSERVGGGRWRHGSLDGLSVG